VAITLPSDETAQNYVTGVKDKDGKKDET